MHDASLNDPVIAWLDQVDLNFKRGSAQPRCIVGGLRFRRLKGGGGADPNLKSWARRASKHQNWCWNSKHNNILVKMVPVPVFDSLLRYVGRKKGYNIIFVSNQRCVMVHI
jgi:hypothetical protein